MPFDGSGNYTPAAAPNFPAVGGAVISATYYNAVINDLATALSNVLTKDGQGKPSVNIDWNAKNLSNIATLGAVTLNISGNTILTGTLTAGAYTGTTMALSGALTLSGVAVPTISSASVLTNKSIDFATNTLTTTLALLNTAVSDADVASLATAQVFTSKTIALGSNTISGTLAEFNTALTGADFATIAGAETFTSKTLTAPTINGGVLDLTSTVGGIVIGYRNVPRVAVAGGTATAAEVGKCYSTSAGMTIPNAVFAAGDSISIFNNTAGNLTITQGASLTMHLVGTATTGNRTLAQKGLATIWFETASLCVITGGGVS